MDVCPCVQTRSIYNIQSPLLLRKDLSITDLLRTFKRLAYPQLICAMAIPITVLPGIDNIVVMPDNLNLNNLTEIKPICNQPGDCVQQSATYTETDVTSCNGTLHNVDLVLVLVLVLVFGRNNPYS